MFSMVKDFMVKVTQGMVNKINFYRDCKQYSKYNYENMNNKSFEAFQGRIFRQTHIVEKGLSLTSPRKGFGVAKINQLLDFIDEYAALGYSKESVVFLNAVNVINQYLLFQKGLGYENRDIENRLQRFSDYIDSGMGCGIMQETKEHLMQLCAVGFEDVVKSRHSVRQFSKEELDYMSIKKAVELAMHSPSECNRQSVKVYLFKDKKIKEQLDDLISGNTGFAGEVKNYLIITSDICSYTSAYERNQMYVDGGLFAMTLMLSLHYYGIASCALQHSETKEKNHGVRQITNIPDNECIVMYLAIGNYKDNFNVAASKRKNIDDVFINM